jgi:precorrin-6A/cobalt-precorrin-6A reductase
MEMASMRVLILGGIAEASELTRLLAADKRFDATVSLAGRTASPKTQPVATRIGGFGGSDGLVA